MEKLTTRNSIMGAFRRRVREIEVPDLGAVLIRPLSGMQRARLADSYKSLDGKTQVEVTRDVQCLVVSWGLVDENGERVFGDGETDQLADLSAPVLDFISSEILRLSGLLAGAVREAEKNSASTPTGSSPTGSVSASGVPTSIAFSKNSTPIN